MDRTGAREIEAAVQEALRLFGAAGSVAVLGNQVELRSGAGSRASGPPVTIEVEYLSEQWPLLPPDMRQRKASDIARRLVDASGKVSGAKDTAERAGGSGRGSRIIAMPVAIAVLAIAGIYAGVRYLREPAPGSGPPERASPAARQESESEATARRALVCEAGRKRIYAGASLGPFDTEGWVVELWLTTSKPGVDIAKSPEVTGLVAGSKLAPGADDTLAALPDASVEIIAGPGAPDAPSSPGWSSVTIRFAGRHASAFLDPALRPRFLGLADRVAVASAAEAGALYGRCAHLRFHDLGAWFYGDDAPMTAVALVASMGLFTELSAVNRDVVASGGELEALRKAAGKMDAATLTGLVGAQGGAISSRATAPRRVTMTFPLGGPTRAATASRGVARAMGVGASGD